MSPHPLINLSVSQSVEDRSKKCISTYLLPADDLSLERHTPLVCAFQILILFDYHGQKMITAFIQAEKGRMHTRTYFQIDSTEQTIKCESKQHPDTAWKKKKKQEIGQREWMMENAPKWRHKFRESEQVASWLGLIDWLTILCFSFV